MGVHVLAGYDAIQEKLVTNPTKDTLQVVDCFATWCGPCKAIAPVLVKHSDEYPNVEFYKIDVDEEPVWSQENGIRAMPTFLFFKNGEVIKRVMGANPPALLSAIVENK